MSLKLPKLSLRELQTLAKLLGCASYGTKETLVVRLLAQRELRFKLARFTDNPDELASSYRRESLRDMCRKAGAPFASVTLVSAPVLQLRKGPGQIT
jgi:hypothetical protein